ncbi:MAG: hypothetical protein ACXWZ3_07465 [Solirubrobacterales bacterium]
MPEGHLRRLDRSYLLALVAGVGAVVAIGLLVQSTRWSVTTLSLIDDWTSARRTQESLGELLHPFFHVLVYRYRPTWDLWSYLEWNTLGAPGNMLGPNLWGVARLLLFIAATVLVPAVIAATSRPRPSPVALASLCVAAGILVFSGPWTNVDFFRLGPQEQVMVGATGCGMALLFWGTGRLLEGARARRTAAATALIVAALVGGWLLWVLGIYHKEASVTVVLLAPFAYLFLDRRWRERGTIERPLWRYWPFRLTVLAMLVPLLHDAIMVSTVSGEGIAEYGAEAPEGLEYVPRSFDAFAFLWNGMSDNVGTPVWTIATILIMASVTVVAVQRRRRLPWLALGLVLTGWALFVLQGLPEQHESRYYIPPMALFVAAAVLVLSQGPRWLLWSAVAGSLVAAVANVDAVADSLDYWEAREADEAKAARLVAEQHPGSCPVYMADLDIERSEALPYALPFLGEELEGPCHKGGTVIVGLTFDLPEEVFGTTEEAGHVCAVKPRVLASTIAWEVTSCPKLRRRVGGQDVRDVLRQNQVVPGIGPIVLRRICVMNHGPEKCGRGRAPHD